MASEALTPDSQAEDLNFSDIPNGLAALKVVPFAGRAVVKRFQKGSGLRVRRGFRFQNGLAFGDGAFGCSGCGLRSNDSA